MACPVPLYCACIRASCTCRAETEGGVARARLGGEGQITSKLAPTGTSAIDTQAVAA